MLRKTSITQILSVKKAHFSSDNSPAHIINKVDKSKSLKDPVSFAVISDCTVCVKIFFQGGGGNAMISNSMTNEFYTK